MAEPEATAQTREYSVSAPNNPEQMRRPVRYGVISAGRMAGFCMLDLMNDQQVEQHFSNMRQAIQEAVRQMPNHREYLAQLRH